VPERTNTQIPHLRSAPARTSPAAVARFCSCPRKHAHLRVRAPAYADPLKCQLRCAGAAARPRADRPLENNHACDRSSRTLPRTRSGARDEITAIPAGRIRSHRSLRRLCPEPLPRNTAMHILATPAPASIMRGSHESTALGFQRTQNVGSRCSARCSSSGRNVLQSCAIPRRQSGNRCGTPPRTAYDCFLPPANAQKSSPRLPTIGGGLAAIMTKSARKQGMCGT